MKERDFLLSRTERKAFLIASNLYFGCFREKGDGEW